MTLYSERIVFPEGDWQEAPNRLRIGDVVDHNGYPLPLPLPSTRILAYRVDQIRVIEEVGEEIRCYRLELLDTDQLEEYI